MYISTLIFIRKKNTWPTTATVEDFLMFKLTFEMVGICCEISHVKEASSDSMALLSSLVLWPIAFLSISSAFKNPFNLVNDT